MCLPSFKDYCKINSGRTHMGMSQNRFENIWQGFNSMTMVWHLQCKVCGKHQVHSINVPSTYGCNDCGSIHLSVTPCIRIYHTIGVAAIFILSCVVFKLLLVKHGKRSLPKNRLQISGLCRDVIEGPIRV